MSGVSETNAKRDWLVAVQALQSPWVAAPSCMRQAGEGSESGDALRRGGLDTAPGTSGQIVDPELAAHELVRALAELLGEDTPQQNQLEAVSQALRAAPMTQQFEPLLYELPEVLAGAGDASGQRLAQWSAWLCREASERSWAVLGLAGAALCAQTDLAGARALAIGLAADPELSAFCLLVLQQTEPEGLGPWLTLAPHTRGGARVWVVRQLVDLMGEMLAADADSPLPGQATEVADWLWRGALVGASEHAQAVDPGASPGLALVVLKVCQPLERMAAAAPGPKLDPCARLLEALLIGDEDVDLDDYPGAGPLALAFARELAAHAGEASLLALSVALHLRAFLEQGGDASQDPLVADAHAAGIEVDAAYLWSQREQVGGWSPQVREDTTRLVQGVLNKPGAGVRAEAALPRAVGRTAFRRALTVARALHVDVDAFALERLHADASWAWLWRKASGSPSQALWDAARSLLPLEPFGRGPALRYEYDASSETHDLLALVVSESLANLQGEGFPSGEARAALRDLWLETLQSPLVRVRDQAIAALANCASDSIRLKLVPAPQLFALADAEPEGQLAIGLRALAKYAQSESVPQDAGESTANGSNER